MILHYFLLYLRVSLRDRKRKESSCRNPTINRGSMHTVNPGATYAKAADYFADLPAGFGKCRNVIAGVLGTVARSHLGFPASLRKQILQ